MIRALAMIAVLWASPAAAQSVDHHRVNGAAYQGIIDDLRADHGDAYWTMMRIGQLGQRVGLTGDAYDKGDKWTLKEDPEKLGFDIADQGVQNFDPNALADELESHIHTRPMIGLGKAR